MPKYHQNPTGKQPAPDGAELSALALGGKRPFKFILMGTPEVTTQGKNKAVDGWMDGCVGG